MAMKLGRRRHCTLVLVMVVVTVLPFISCALSAGKKQDRVLDLQNLGMSLPIDYSSLAGDVKTIESLMTSKPFKYLEFDSMFDALQLGKVTENVSPKCASDTSYLFSSNKTRTQLVQYIDAAGKVPRGVLQGNWLWIGDSKACQSIAPVHNANNNTYFKGRYYSMFFFHSNLKPVIGPYPIVIGACAPSSCSEKDLQNYVNSKLDVLRLGFIVSGVVSDDIPKVDNNAIGVMTYIGILVTLVLIGTIVDLVFPGNVKKADVSCSGGDVPAITTGRDTAGLLSGDLFSETVQVERFQTAKHWTIELLRAFSFIANAKKLFGTSTAVGPLTCLNGLRVLSMWWVILGHTYAFVIYFLDNIAEAVEIEKRFSFQPVLNGTFSVDCFFFLSGLLVAYIALKELYDKGRLNWIYFFIHRFWRLMPLYLLALLFYAFIYEYTAYGSMSFFMSGVFKNQTDVCKKYLWTNLLFINNFYPDYGNISTTCMGWSWYLANDMQFYIILSPIVIITIYKRKRIGLLITSILILLEVIIRGVLTGYYGMHGLQGAATKHMTDPIAKNGVLYARPWARYSVYLIGMLTGYVLAVKKNRIHIPRFGAVIGWCAAIATGMALIYGQYAYVKNSTQMGMVQSIFYVSLCRMSWALCLSWVVLACVAGKAGPANSILSWKIWAPLGRLTYAAYLVHPMIIFWYYMVQSSPIHFNDPIMVCTYSGMLVLSYTVAFVMSMITEAPMMQLEKVIVKAIKQLLPSEWVNTHT